MPDEYVNPWWQASLLPAKWDICGVVVGVLSVWHLYALENIGNPYACGSACDLDAAASLLLICGRDYAGGRALYLQPFARARALRQVFRAVRKIDPVRLESVCADYFTACTRVPEHLQKMDGSGKPYSAPYQRHIVLCLCDRYGMNLEQAWNHPYAEARCMFDVFCESRGDESVAGEIIQRHTDDALERRAKEQVA